MTTRLRQIAGFLQQAKTLRGQLEQIERDQRLLKRVRKALPPPLRGHCLQAIGSGRTLVLVTASSAWATQLRFMAPEILKTIAGSGAGLRECRVRVRPPASSLLREDPRRPRPWLSARTATHLAQAADGLTDPDLAAALRRLSVSGTKPATADLET